MKRTFIATLLFTFSLTGALAQMARLYTTQHGLKTNIGNSIDIDSRGLVWISGLNTLGIFDGTRFQYLPTTTPDGRRQLFQSAYRTREQGDNKYWICTSHGLFLFDAPRSSYQRIQLQTEEDSVYGCAVNNIIDYPLPDHKLVTTDGFGIFALNTQTQKTDSVLSRSLIELAGTVFTWSPVVDGQKRLWMATLNEPLVCIETNRLKRHTFSYTPEAAVTIAASKVNCIVETDGDLLIGTNNGLLIYDKQQNTVRLPKAQNPGLNITSIIRMRDGRVLIGTDGQGIWETRDSNADGVLAPLNGTSANFEMTYGKVKDIQEDSEGNIVAFFLQKGLVVIPTRNDNFHYHPISPLSNGKNATSITSLAIDANQNYWVGTDGCGVFTTKGMRLATASPISNGLNSLLVQDVKIDRHGTVWACSFGGGVQYLKGGQWTDGGWLAGLNKEFSMTMYYNAKTDQLLLGTNGNGIFCIDIAKQSYSKLDFPFDYNQWISCVIQDSRQTLWMATSSGLFYYNRKSGKHGEIMQDGNRICNAGAIAEDGKEILIAYDDGLIIYNIETGKQELIDANQGLNNLPVRSITSTPTYFWLATRTGIASVDKKTRQIRNYSSFVGYDIGEFHRNSLVKAGKDYILFGGDNGIICFRPESISRNKTGVKHVYFTDLYTPMHTEKLDASISYAKKIQLDSDNGSFVIYFSAAELGDPERVHYDYTLEGHEQQWHCDVPDPSANYSSLPAGNYTFRVRAYMEDNPDTWTESKMKINVAAPWYATGVAFMIYFLILCGIVYLVYQQIMTRKQQQEQLRHSAEQDRMKEAKLRLFTSITHELRSPLTMIESPLKQLMAEDQNADHQSLYSVMQRNCNRLLDIVKQITDIRKIDSGQLTLKLEEHDYVEYSDQVFEQFKGIATVKGISFIVEHSEEELPMMMDVTHFEKIITNLLSNAFKFTPQGGKVIVRSGVVGSNVELRFYNSGSHLGDEDMKHLWERFYQGGAGSDATGSGIGLNLVYELVKLHHGTIETKNIEPDGVEFTLHFPYFNLATTEPGNTNAQSNHQTRPTVMLVDDDTELVNYVSGQLEKDYTVICAFSGNTAWKKVLAQRPDVVVTDYRMADGNGVELCQRIKSNPETDNTPVIMLTGEGDETLRLHSLNIQVDHYLEKPVNLMMLRSAISQVLRVRETLRNKVRRTEMGNEMPKPVMENADDKLFNRVNETIKKHLDNSEFSVQQLSEEVGISRVHLNRKMKERYGVSPNVFIKSFRLKQAAYLLVKNSVNVSEVAYTVGFSSHSYFTTSFHDYFGMSPKEFIAFYSEEENSEALQKLLE